MKKMYLIVLLLFVLIFTTMSSIQAAATNELFYAAANGDIIKVRQLIEEGANVNLRIENQWTPLQIAVTGGKTDVVRLLIEKGADINGRLPDQRTPLHTAAYMGRTDEAKFLIEKGADIRARDEKQNTPLHTASTFGKTDVARVLLDKGADINARNTDKDTPLHLAARGGKIDVAKLLVERGADVNAQSNVGDQTPVMAAQNYPELVAIIRKQSGRPEEFDNLVRTRGWDTDAIVRMARSLNPPPKVPLEARDEMTKGVAAFKMAKRPEDFKVAEAHFDRASRLAPWLPEPYFNLALAQEKLAYAREQQRKLHSAKENLEKYLIAASDAKDIQAGKQKIAELEVQAKRYDDFSNEVSLGIDAYKKGQSGYTEAARYWRRAIEIGPDYPNVYIVYSNLGEVAMYQGDLDASYNYYQKSFELMPDPSVIPARSVNTGVVLERRGDRAKACTYYKKACDAGDKVGCGNMRNCP